MNSVIPSILPSIFPSIEGSIVSASGTPSLLLDFARNAYSMGAIGSVPSDRTFASLITFSRASSGGRINAAGEFEWVGNDVPRLTYDPVTLQPLGLLVEEQRTNLLLRSEEFNDAYWAKSGIAITADAALSPSGLASADKLVEDSSVGIHAAFRAYGAAVVGSYTYSVYVKAAGRDTCFIRFGMDSSGFGAKFNLLTGAISEIDASIVAAIEDVGGGWFRCSISRSATTTASLTVYSYIRQVGAYTGDGVSGVYVWGAQLEAGSSATSYIPTTTTQVTRAADVCSVNALSPWYNAIEGTLVATCIPAQSTPASQFLMGLTDGTSSNRVAAFYATPGGNPSAVASVLGSSVFASVTGKARATRLAMSYGGGFLKMAAGGSSVSTAALPSAPTVNRLTIGALNGSTSLNGIIQSITYYPRVIDVQQASA